MRRKSMKYSFLGHNSQPLISSRRSRGKDGVFHNFGISGLMQSRIHDDNWTFSPQNIAQVRGISSFDQITYIVPGLSSISISRLGKLEKYFSIKIGMCIWLLLFATGPLEAQQLPQWSQFSDMGFIWNPALTAKWSRIETGFTQMNNMSGFEGAPRTSALHFQMPFGYQYNRMRIRSNAIGASLTSDRLGPMDFNQLHLNYVYRWHPAMFGNRRDVISLGSGVGWQQVGIRLNELNAFSPEEQAVWMGGMDQEAFNTGRWNASFGVYYSSVSDFYYDEDSYYAGFSFNNLNISSVSMPGFLSFQPVIHGTFLAGYRKVLMGGLILEPSVLCFVSAKGQFITSANIKLESPRQFWLTAGAEQQGNFSAGAGWMFDRSSALGSLVKDGMLKLGVRAEYNLGALRRYGGMGFEAYVGYLFHLDEYY